MKRCSLVLACLALIATVGRVSADEPSEKIAQLQREVAQLKERVRQLEYPELRKCDADEIRILTQRVETAERIYRKIFGLFLATAQEGSMENLARSGRLLTNSRVKLAWARRDVRGAVRQSALAVGFAQLEQRSADAALGAGMLTLDVALEAQIANTDAQHALLRARKAAALLKVDVTDIRVPDISKRIRIVSTLQKVDVTDLGAADIEQRLKAIDDGGDKKQKKDE